MADSDSKSNKRAKEEPTTEKVEQQVVQTEEEADVLEEDDDFEEFQCEAVDENGEAGFEDVEWEDNWDDEVEGENDFSKRLRAELEKSREEAEK